MSGEGGGYATQPGQSSVKIVRCSPQGGELFFILFWFSSANEIIFFSPQLCPFFRRCVPAPSGSVIVVASGEPDRKKWHKSSIVIHGSVVAPSATVSTSFAVNPPVRGGPLSLCFMVVFIRLLQAIFVMIVSGFGGRTDDHF